MYNVHPIFVHFPVALLTLYSLLRVLPLGRWFPRVAWRDIERLLLVVGFLGAMVSLSTGETAEHLVHPNRQLVEMHSSLASIATWVYGILLLGEAVAIARMKFFTSSTSYLSQALLFLEKIICNRFIGILLALAGLVTIAITGMLGGIIAYGVSADPLAPFLLRMLGITL